MRYRDLTDFWPVFLSAHLSPWNRRFHLIGNFIMLSCWLLFMISLNIKFLLLSIVGYIPSWLGHLFFEGKEPPTFLYPIISGLANFKMLGMILGGALPKELKRLYGTNNPVPGSAVIISPENERRYQEQLRFYISDAIPKHPFTNYWEIFVLKHQKKINIWAHVIAMYILYGIIAFAFIKHDWQILFAIPIASIIGLISHNFTERTHIDFQDAIFSPRAFYCLNRMMVGVISGDYWKELKRVQEELKNYLTKN